VGAKRHHRFHAPTTQDLYWLRSQDRQDHGTQGCVARRSWIWNPNDSVLHQSRWEEPQHTKARGARAGEAHTPAASQTSEIGVEKAVASRVRSTPVRVDGAVIPTWSSLALALIGMLLIGNVYAKWWVYCVWQLNRCNASRPASGGIQTPAGVSLSCQDYGTAAEQRAAHPR
jgi:hypothetical protein